MTIVFVIVILSSFDIRDYSRKSAQCHILADIIDEQFIDLMSYFSDVLFNFQMKMETVNVTLFLQSFAPRWELFVRLKIYLDSKYEQLKDQKTVD